MSSYRELGSNLSSLDDLKEAMEAAAARKSINRAAVTRSIDRAEPNPGGGGEKRKSAAAAIPSYAHVLSAMPRYPHAPEETHCYALASPAMSYRDVLVSGIYPYQGKETVASELPVGTVEEVDPASGISIYCDTRKVESELPGSSVEEKKEVVDDDDEILKDEGEAADYDEWKAMESELPWAVVVEEEEEETKEERKEEEVLDDDDDDDVDDEELIEDEDKAAESEMRSFRRGWVHCFGDLYGSFADNTSVRPMRYTEGRIPRYASPEVALQIFSVQVKEIKGGLKWPLHVYGHVASRDSVDFNRNIIFNRTRENCQILTQEDSYLLLTGPSRAVVLIDPVMFEINLRVRGGKESEDQILSLNVFEHKTVHNFLYGPFMTVESCCSKRSMLEFTFAVLPDTVEATIDSVQVIDGSWPDNICGNLFARTTSIKNENILLLDSRNERMPIKCEGQIELSRSVVSVELNGKLEVYVAASQVDNKSVAVVKDCVVFTARRASRSRGICDLGFCKVEITVAWSLLATLVDMLPRSKKHLAFGIS